MPCTSSGAVSLRTRITASPRLPHSAAVSASKTIRPAAAPGDALSPVPAMSYLSSGSMREKNSASSWRGSTRQIASSFDDQPFVNEIERDLDRGLGAAFAAARLKHVQLAALDRELEVLHVAVVRFELLGDRDELRVHGRLRFLQIGDLLGRADARHDVFALSVAQVLAEQLARAGVGIARERDARPRIVAHVAEHHRDDADRRAPIVGHLVVGAVIDRALGIPGVEHGPDGEVAAARRRLGESRVSRSRLTIVEILRDQRLPIVRAQLRVGLNAELRFGRVQQAFKVLFVDLQARRWRTW